MKADIIKVPCPKCCDPLYFHSKAGNCEDKTYNIDDNNLPPIIAGDLDKKEIYCSSCGVKATIHTKAIILVR